MLGYNDSGCAAFWWYKSSRNWKKYWNFQKMHLTRRASLLFFETNTSKIAISLWLCEDVEKLDPTWPMADQVGLQNGSLTDHCYPSLDLSSLKLTSHLKMDGWNTSFLLGFGLFSGAFAVSFREGISCGFFWYFYISYMLGSTCQRPNCHHLFSGKLGSFLLSLLKVSV